jgi:hypothetical protein
MRSRFVTAGFLGLMLWGPVLSSQAQHIRHSRYPSAAANDPLLQLPQDQSQACFTPESSSTLIRTRCRRVKAIFASTYRPAGRL